jgi:hypothetical protein
MIPEPHHIIGEIIEYDLTMEVLICARFTELNDTIPS